MTKGKQFQKEEMDSDTMRFMILGSECALI